jgi:hypothetical protein
MLYVLEDRTVYRAASMRAVGNESFVNCTLPDSRRCIPHKTSGTFFVFLSHSGLYLKNLLFLEHGISMVT